MVQLRHDADRVRGPDRSAIEERTGKGGSATPTNGTPSCSGLRGSTGSEAAAASRGEPRGSRAPGDQPGNRAADGLTSAGGTGRGLGNVRLPEATGLEQTANLRVTERRPHHLIGQGRRCCPGTRPGFLHLLATAVCSLDQATHRSPAESRCRCPSLCRH